MNYRPKYRIDKNESSFYGNLKEIIIIIILQDKIYGSILRDNNVLLNRR